MNFFYPILIAFIFVFVSELGDKTQLLVMSFSAKQKVVTILIGVALGSLLSHGVAIIFGSSLGLIQNEMVEKVLKILTHLSFIIFGIFTLWNKKEDNRKENGKKGILQKIASSKLNYILVIALSIAIGELGDKTFLASVGLGIQYPSSKIALVIGAVFGMVVSDLLAIIFGKAISKKVKERTMEKISGVLFLIFGILGMVTG